MKRSSIVKERMNKVTFENRSSEIHAPRIDNLSKMSYVSKESSSTDTFMTTTSPVESDVSAKSSSEFASEIDTYEPELVAPSNRGQLSARRGPRNTITSNTSSIRQSVINRVKTVNFFGTSQAIEPEKKFLNNSENSYKAPFLRFDSVY